MYGSLLMKEVENIKRTGCDRCHGGSAYNSIMAWFDDSIVVSPLSCKWERVFFWNLLQLWKVKKNFCKSCCYKCQEKSHKLYRLVFTCSCKLNNNQLIEIKSNVYNHCGKSGNILKTSQNWTSLNHFSLHGVNTKYYFIPLEIRKCQVFSSIEPNWIKK